VRGDEPMASEGEAGEKRIKSPISEYLRMLREEPEKLKKAQGAIRKVAFALADEEAKAHPFCPCEKPMLAVGSSSDTELIEVSCVHLLCGRIQLFSTGVLTKRAGLVILKAQQDAGMATAEQILQIHSWFEEETK